MPEKKIKWTGDQLNAINSDGTFRRYCSRVGGGRLW